MPAVHFLDPVNIAVACDRNYVMPLAATVASLHATLDPQRELVVHVLGSGLCRDTWRRLKDTLSEERVRWNCIDVPASVPGGGYRTRPWEHVSAVCYYRLLLPELLPPDLDRVLYLDGDLIVRADVGELFNLDMGEYALAAAVERDRRAHTAASSGGIRLYRELELAADQRQFNAGVLLVNLPSWRRARLAERAFDYVRQSGADLRWYEQEALNVVMRGDFLALEPRWNCAVGIDSTAEIEAAAILHYLSARKPWHWDYDPALAAPFFAALDRTPWSGWRPARPPNAALGQLVIRANKALKKRLHRYEAACCTRAARRRYRRAKPMRVPDTAPPPVVDACEIRLFLRLQGHEAGMVPMLDAWFEAGIDRAIVLVGADAVPAVPRMPERAGLVHIYVAPDGLGQEAQRHLLHRYGHPHWCVLGEAWEAIVEAEGQLVDLARLCAELDASGLEVQEGLTAEGEELRLTARDVRTNRIFTATARGSRPACSWETAPLTSRVVAIRYNGNMRLDREARLCGYARKSISRLRLRRMVFPEDTGS